MKISANEWQSEISKVMGHTNDSGKTSEELSTDLNLQRGAVYTRLHALRKAGRLGVGWRNSITLLGFTRRIPVYWIKEKKR